MVVRKRSMGRLVDQSFTTALEAIQPLGFCPHRKFIHANAVIKNAPISLYSETGYYYNSIQVSNSTASGWQASAFRR